VHATGCGFSQLAVEALKQATTSNDLGMDRALALLGLSVHSGGRASLSSRPTPVRTHHLGADMLQKISHNRKRIITRMLSRQNTSGGDQAPRPRAQRARWHQDSPIDSAGVTRGMNDAAAGIATEARRPREESFDKTVSGKSTSDSLPRRAILLYTYRNMWSPVVSLPNESLLRRRSDNLDSLAMTSTSASFRAYENGSPARPKPTEVEFSGSTMEISCSCRDPGKTSRLNTMAHLISARHRVPFALECPRSRSSCWIQPEGPGSAERERVVRYQNSRKARRGLKD